MDCRIQSNSHNSNNNSNSAPPHPAMINTAISAPPPTTVNGPGSGSVPPTPSTPPGAAEQAQFEADKRSVYKHPLFPLLALLFERCELATQSSDTQSSDAFTLDIQAFVQHQERDRKPFLSNEPEIDGLMIKAIQVLRIHLLELEKVQELCKDFCNRYITCLKGKMQSEHLLRADYAQGIRMFLPAVELPTVMHTSDGSSGSQSNSPIQQQYAVNAQQAAVAAAPPAALTLQHHPPTNNLGMHPGASNYGGGGGYSTAPPPPPPSSTSSCDTMMMIHGSTPLGQIGVNLCSGGGSSNGSSGGGDATALSPAPTTPGGGAMSADDCDDLSDFGPSSRGSNKQKRGVLPKQATSVMRSWLFQHLMHPYPSEDEKRHIAAQTNLTLLQVNNWFINARRRILQPMLDASSTNPPHPPPQPPQQQQPQQPTITGHDDAVNMVAPPTKRKKSHHRTAHKHGNSRKVDANADNDDFYHNALNNNHNNGSRHSHNARPNGGSCSVTTDSSGGDDSGGEEGDDDDDDEEDDFPDDENSELYSDDDDDDDVDGQGNLVIDSTSVSHNIQNGGGVVVDTDVTDAAAIVNFLPPIIER